MKKYFLIAILFIVPLFSTTSYIIDNSKVYHSRVMQVKKFDFFWIDHPAIINHIYLVGNDTPAILKDLENKFTIARVAMRPWNLFLSDYDIFLDFKVDVDHNNDLFMIIKYSFP